MFDRNNTIASYRLNLERIKRGKKGMQVHHPIGGWMFLKRNTAKLPAGIEEELMEELYEIFTISDEDDKIIPLATENLILSFDYFDKRSGRYRNNFEYYDGYKQQKYVKYREKEIDYDAINLFASLAVKYKRAKNIFFATYDISVFSVINPQKLNMPCVFLKKDGQIEFIEKKITTKQLKNYDTSIQVPVGFEHAHFREGLQ